MHGAVDLGQVLPVVEIKPASGLYDHEAKYLRDDTIFTVGLGRPRSAGRSRRGNHPNSLRSGRTASWAGRFHPWPRRAVFRWNAMPGFTASSLLLEPRPTLVYLCLT